MDKQQINLFDGFARELANTTGAPIGKAKEVLTEYFRDSAYGIDTSLEQLVKSRINEGEIWRNLVAKVFGI